MSLDAERQFLCPRLIDYLAIVGVKPVNSSKPSSNPSIQVRLLYLISNEAGGKVDNQDINTP